MDGDLIIDGNTVYEIDKDCEGKLSKTEIVQKNNNLLCGLVFLMMLKKFQGEDSQEIL